MYSRWPSVAFTSKSSSLLARDHKALVGSFVVLQVESGHRVADRKPRLIERVVGGAELDQGSIQT
jgi:hypothetical protein